MRAIRSLPFLLLAFLLVVGVAASSAQARARGKEYLIPTPSSYPAGITAGADGAMWFTEAAGNNIGRITTQGTIIEFPIPTPNSGPAGIAACLGRDMCFAELSGNKIGAISSE